MGTFDLHCALKAWLLRDKDFLKRIFGMVYPVIPTNNAAVDAVALVAGKIDSSLEISEAQKASIAAFILAHRRQDILFLNNKSAGHPSLLGALLDAGVLGWAGGNAGYTVKQQYRERFGLTFSTVEDGSLHSHPVSRSGLWYRNRMSTRFLYWEDVVSLEFAPAFFVLPVDFVSTVAAFRDGHRPSGTFQRCYYPPDVAEAELFLASVLAEAQSSGIALAQIADGFVCADPVAVTDHFDAHAAKTYSREGVGFSIATKDRQGRASQCLGRY
jgi:hypothetical protein